MTIDASARPTPSPIVRVLNEEVRHYHRWCTPSTLVQQERIEDFYASDVSISAGFFGTLVDHTGVFGEAERFAAAAQGADRTMFSVHGSTGSNFIVLRMLALERPDALVLVARNCHHSTINAIKAFGLDFRFLPSPYDARVRGGPAAVGRPGRDRAAALPRGRRRRLHLADLRGPVREHARHRRRGPRRLRAHDAVRRRGLGRAPALPSRAAAVGHGRGRGHLRAVDAQAGGRAPADRPDPLARGAGGLRADGGGVPRVRHDLAELPPARVGRRRRPLARRHRP